MSNFFIAKPLEPDTPIYRFLTFPSLMTILEERKLPLRKITKWDDPWEVPARHLYSLDDWETKEKEYKVYGNCWSENSDSDALWRIYSQDRKGVCILSTIGMLQNTIVQKHPKISACIAKVIYDTVENNLLNELFGGKFSDKYPVPYSYAYMKGKAFEHEQEVRFLVYAKDLSSPTPEFIYIKNIDHRRLIKEVIFDPRVEDWYFESMKKYLDKYKMKCRKSPLYTPRKLNVTLKADVSVTSK